MFTSTNPTVAVKAAATQRVSFTSVQVNQALSADRIFVVPDRYNHDEFFGGARLADYPYAMITFMGGLANVRVADAWRINARGEAYPGHIAPTPHILSEVTPFDMAPAPLRRNLIAFAQASRNRNAGFVNEPTMRAAQVLVSDQEAWEYVGNAAPAGQNWPVRAATALRHFASARRALFSPTPISLSEVDWSEVAEQFREESGESPSPAPATKADLPLKTAAIPAAAARASQTPAAKADSDSDQLPDREIPADILDVLRQSHAQGQYIYLPKAQLDRVLYGRLDKVLRDLGGKWVGGSRRAHAFDVDAQDILATAIATGRYVRPADLGFFPTPAALVNKLISKAQLARGMPVLEPQGGTGNLACAMAASVGSTDLVTVCELMERNVRVLREAGFSKVIHRDFLRLAPSRVFEAACMNPPFSQHQDIDHVLHASRFVVPGGSVTSYMSSAWVHSRQRKAVAFRQFLETVKADVEHIESGAFKESGTDVATTLVHFKV